MPTQRKILTVKNLEKKFARAKGLVLTDYTGLNVARITELRKAVKKVNGEFEVSKNSLLRLAAKTGLPRKFAAGEPLRGPTAALWIYNNDLMPLRIMNDFIKKFDLPKIKFGFWEGDFLSLEAVQELANLPGIEQMRAIFVGRLMSPISRLPQILQGNFWKLIFILGKGGDVNGGQRRSQVPDGTRQSSKS